MKVSESKNFRILYLVIGLCIISIANGKIYSECSLARTLYYYRVPYNELADWVCLAKYESGLNSKAFNPSNSDGSRDWGLFQINDRYWCSPSDGHESSNGCGLPCGALMSNDIRYGIYCARIIMKEQGLKAWVAWNRYCKDSKPSVKHCFR